MKFITTIFFCILASFSCRGASDDQVWIAILVMDRGFGQAVNEYYGMTDRKTFTALTEIAEPTGFLKLQNSMYFYQGSYIPQIQANTKERQYGYSNTLYVRAENITRIIPLDSKFVSDTLLPALVLKNDSSKKAHDWTPKERKMNFQNSWAE